MSDTDVLNAPTRRERAKRQSTHDWPSLIREILKARISQHDIGIACGYSGRFEINKLLNGDVIEPLYGPGAALLRLHAQYSSKTD